MKKTFIVLAAMFVTSIAAKAWEVGDFYDQDPTGVPAVVVYVDDSGEHGLIMSPKAFTEKNYKKFVKAIDKAKVAYDKRYQKKAKKEGISADEIPNQKAFEKVLAWYESAPRLSEGKVNKKIYKQCMKDLPVLTNEYGEENMKSLATYCTEKSIDMSSYFFPESWAIQLGEGWFIPGNYELELLSKHFIDGLGEKNHIPMLKFMDRNTEWYNLLGPLALPSYVNVQDPNTMFPSFIIRSSTMVKSSWAEKEENKKKTSGVNTSDYYVLAALTRQITMYYWWALCENWGDETHIVAFKHF